MTERDQSASWLVFYAIRDGHNQNRTHSLLTARPPKDMRGKYPRPNAKRRPKPPDAGRLWEVWK